LLRFWFRFIFPSTNYIRHMGADRALKDLIRPHPDSWYGQCLERFCREALPWLYLEEGVTAAFEVGQYWSKTTQIDVVGLRDDGWTDLGECKWGTVHSPKAVEQELEAKVREFPNPEARRLGGGSSPGSVARVRRPVHLRASAAIGCPSSRRFTTRKKLTLAGLEKARE